MKIKLLINNRIYSPINYTAIQSQEQIDANLKKLNDNIKKFKNKF